MAKNRAKVPNNLESMSRSDWEHLIEQYIKSEEDREIAKLYYLDGYCQIDIAEKYFHSRSCIKHRLKNILDILEKHSFK